MMLPSLALSLLVAPGSPSMDTWQAHEAECRRLEDEIKAPAAGGIEPLEAGARYIAAADACRRAFEAVPAGGKAMDLRSYFVFEAHRLYQLAHDAGSEAALCADAQALDMFAAQLAELKPGLRARDRRDVVRMRAQIEAQLPGPCPASAAEEAAPEPLLPVATVVRDPVRAAPVVPVAPQPLPRVDLTPSPSARRPLRIVGGAALGLGLGLGAGMIAALVRGASLHERTTTVSNAYKGQLIPEPENGQFELDRVRGQRADNAAIGLGIAGGLLAVVGVSLLVVDHGRAPRRVAIGPILPTAGLRLALEF